MTAQNSIADSEVSVPKLCEVQFKGSRRGVYLNPRGIPLSGGQYVVVQARKGEDIGVVTKRSQDSIKESSRAPRGDVLRRATMMDIEKMLSNREREIEAFEVCQERIEARGLDMKLVDVECQYDRSKIRFYFTAEERVDFRKLVRDLAAHFKTRIEMRQIGVRDEAKSLGGFGRCGREYCCATFLSEFEPVTLKMAKEQHLAPGSPKISGACGRLMCCLRYEGEFYKRASGRYPKEGEVVILGGEKLQVADSDIFHGTITTVDSAGEEQTLTLKEYEKAKRRPRRARDDDKDDQD
jgi:cell fate regulator YaaT (PSP1 superfamily)